MSQRNSPEAKLERRARRSLKQPPAGYIDLIAWVKDRAHVSTRRAVAVIMEGTLKVDSHVIGRAKIGKTGLKVLDRYVPASYRGRIEVVVPESVRDAEVSN